MKTALNALLVTLYLIGSFVGFYLGEKIAKGTIQWNFYQPSEGQDMGRWKVGSSGDGLAFIISFILIILCSELGLFLGWVIIRYCRCHLVGADSTVFKKDEFGDLSSLLQIGFLLGCLLALAGAGVIIRG